MTFDDTQYSEDELTSALQSSIADALNIHESDVEIIIDAETGEVSYTITSTTAEDASSLQNVLQEPTTSDIISSGVSEAIPALTEVIFGNIRQNLHF
eukprot:UN22923